MRLDQHFLRETRADIQTLSDQLISLEGTQTDATSLDEAFRTAHTLKGNLGMVDLDEEAALAHALEDVLDAVRTGNQRTDRPTVNAMLDAVDAIERNVERAAIGDTPPAVDEERERLRSIAGTDADATTRGDEGPAHGGDDTAAESTPAQDAATAAPATESPESSTERMDAPSTEPEPSAETMPDLDDDALEAFNNASEFDDLDALIDEMDDDGDELGPLEGGGSLDGFDEPEHTAPEAGVSEPAQGESAPGGNPRSAGEPLTRSEPATAPDRSGDQGEPDDADDDPPTAPGGMYDEFTEIREEVDDSGSLDELEEDIDAVEFGEFDEEDDMSISELLETEPDDEESAVIDAEPTPDTAATEPTTAVDDQTVVDTEGTATGPTVDAEPTADGEIATADGVRSSEEPATGDASPMGGERPVGAEPTAASSGDTTASETPDDESIHPFIEASVNNDDLGASSTVDGDEAAADDGASSALSDVLEAIESDADESAAAAADEATPADTAGVRSAGPAEQQEPQSTATTEPTAPGDTIHTQQSPDTTEARATTDATETTEPHATGDAEPDMPSGPSASIDELVNDEAASESLRDFTSDDSVDDFEATFGELFEGGDSVESGPTRTVTTLAESDAAIPAAETEPDEQETLPAGLQTTSTSSLSVDVEVGDQLLQQVRRLDIAQRELANAVADDPAVQDALEAIGAAVDDLRQTATDVRLVPISSVTDGFSRVIRRITRGTDVEAELETQGTDIKLDRDVLDRIGDPLVHLVRNAVDHGIEPVEERRAAGKPAAGTVEIRARRKDSGAILEVRDDGRGIDPESIRQQAVERGIISAERSAELSPSETYDLIFEPGFSTADGVTETSGRGVGMDAVSRAVSDLNGSIEVESTSGEGTTVRLSVPVSVAVSEVVFVEAGGQRYAVPTAEIKEIQRSSKHNVTNGSVEMRTAAGTRSLPLVRLGEAVGTGAGDLNTVLRIDPSVRDVALGCDAAGHKREAIITPYQDVLRETPGVGGATLLDDNTVINVIDVETL